MLVPPIVAAMLSTQLLHGRSQDLWGIILVPMTERLTEKTQTRSMSQISTKSTTRRSWGSYVVAP